MFKRRIPHPHGPIIRGLFIFLVVGLFLFLVAYVTMFISLNTRGRETFISAVEEKLGEKPTLESFSVHLPLTIKLKGFQCGDIAFEQAHASLGLYNPFISRLTLGGTFLVEGLKVKGEIRDNQIVFKPIEIKTDGKKEGQKESSQEPAGSLYPEPVTSRPQRALSVKVKRMYIKDARLEFIDFTQGRVNPFVVSDLEVEIKDFVYPDFSRCSGKITASLQSGDRLMQDLISVNGWVDYFNRDMDVDVQLDRLDYLAFKEYYPKFWKPDNLGIQEAWLSFKSKLQSQRNELTATCMLSVDEIAFLEEAEGDSKARYVKTVLALIQGQQERPTLTFKLKTKMDSPTIDRRELKKNLTGVIRLGPALIVEQVVKKASDTVSKALRNTDEINADSASEAIEDVVDSIKDIFVPPEKSE